MLAVGRKGDEGQSVWAARWGRPCRCCESDSQARLVLFTKGSEAMRSADPEVQTPNLNQMVKEGIELNRAYAIVTGGDFEDYKLMRLRIPLSPDGTAKEWNGKWSDHSGAWSTRLMQMLHYSRDSADGTFWMEYADLCKHFTKVDGRL